jgi:hypothetical protein
VGAMGNSGEPMVILSICSYNWLLEQKCDEVWDFVGKSYIVVIRLPTQKLDCLSSHNFGYDENDVEADAWA